MTDDFDDQVEVTPCVMAAGRSRCASSIAARQSTSIASRAYQEDCCNYLDTEPSGSKSSIKSAYADNQWGHPLRRCPKPYETYRLSSNARSSTLRRKGPEYDTYPVLQGLGRGSGVLVVRASVLPNAVQFYGEGEDVHVDELLDGEELELDDTSPISVAPPTSRSTTLDCIA